MGLYQRTKTKRKRLVMKLVKRVRAKDVQVGDELIPLYYWTKKHGYVVGSIKITKRNNIMFYRYPYSTDDAFENYNLIMDNSIPPEQWLEIIVDGEPSPEVGLYDI